ncbi:hypothetical protein OAB41_04645 [Gammaproteobacteria bacterium]|nr:hypothetical protein [Gammaproteobacteria bacterium]
MKKLLALLLLSPLVVSEEVEYPIELTCEVAANVYHINFDKDSESWIKRISGSMQITPGLRGAKLVIRKFKVTEDEIRVDKQKDGALRSLITSIKINRYTLGFNDFMSDGQCFKGFKEYTEKQI